MGRLQHKCNRSQFIESNRGFIRLETFSERKKKHAHGLMQVYFQTTYDNTLRIARFRGFSAKKHLNARGFAREFLRSCMLYRPGKSIKKRGQSSRLDSKKNFCEGGGGCL